MRQNHAGLVLVIFLSPLAAADNPNSPSIRGEHSDGLAEGKKLPDRWSTTENVVWKKDIPGWGWSSPIIWGNRIFVTSAVGEKELPKPVVGGYPGGFIKPDDVQRYMLYCLDVESGKVLWEREAHKGVAPQPRHPKNSYASETPVTDGERVYAYFGNIGIFAYDLKGEKIWEQKLGNFKVRGGWGTGTSTVLLKDRLFVVNDNEEKSFLVALDKHTGKELWRVDREEKSNWATPYVWENEKRTELVTVGTGKVRSYDLEGKLLWELKGTSGLVSLMPIAKKGLLYVGAGYHIGPLYAIRPGATGDISLKPDQTSNEWVVWSQPKGAGIHPAFLISGDRLFSLFDAGLLTCSDAKTGKVLYDRQRIETKSRFYASPWAYNGKIYLLNEDGTT
ncbi:MAG: PQQ-like beta-propeller repeat protein [Planctomycetes bacterium]|nr:PQQ-like beta-propeller repeat protein [Planctomycetota bacterium]